MSRKKRQPVKRKRSSRSTKPSHRSDRLGVRVGRLAKANVVTAAVNEPAASVAVASEAPAMTAEQSTQSYRSPPIASKRSIYWFDFLFNGLHTALDWTQDVVEFALDLFLRVSMTKPVQFTAGALTGVLCLMLAYQILAFMLALFGTSYYL